MSGEVCWINRHFEGSELFVFVLGVTHTGTSQKIRIWWKNYFFLVRYFKKWNFHIFRFITCKVKHFKSCFVLMCMVGAYSSWNKKNQYLKILILFPSRTWHLPTLPKITKAGSMTMVLLCLIGQQTCLTWTPKRIYGVLCLLRFAAAALSSSHSWGEK